MNLEEGPFVFRINDNGSGPNLLIQVCMERGWREYAEGTPVKDGWNLWWRTSAFSVSQHKHLKAWQFTNHIPKGSSICRKDNLARNLKCMKKVYGAVYDISPLGYNLPLEYTKLVADCSRRDEDEDDSQKVWICKPVGQSQGRGIFLFKSLNDLCYDSNAVVQKYIKNPLLIGGYKFDLRLYVCVPSYHPLTVYLYKEGIVRFSTDKFSLSDLNNPFCHLTNSSLNKLGPGYSEQKDRIGSGCKWSLKQLRQYFQQAGIRDWLLWQKISALVTLTILSQSTSIPQTTNCFEFYGFDVLIDEKLKPWLLEVNVSPALGNDCDIDPVVKKPLLHDLFDLLGLPICNTGLSLFTVFSPCDRQMQWSSDPHSDNEERNVGSSQSIVRAKQKPAMTAPASVTNRGGSASKSTPSSAALVATAATKWRKKRKSNCSSGAPSGNSAEHSDAKTEKGVKPKDKAEEKKSEEKVKEPEKVESEKVEVEGKEAEQKGEEKEAENKVTEKNEVEKSEVEKNEVEKSEVEKNEVEKSEVEKNEVEKSEVEKIEVEKSEIEKTEAERNEVGKNEVRTSKKKVLVCRRNREKESSNKAKPDNSDVQNTGKLKQDNNPSVKAVALPADGPKAAGKTESSTGENKAKKKKKLDTSIKETKHNKCCLENKSNYFYDRPTKVYPGQVQTFCSTKSVTFPLDKSAGFNRGFRGRTKALSPMLWGNGRDWRTPIHQEGDWSRIYPLSNFASKYNSALEDDSLGNKCSVGDKQIRLVVHHVTNFIKVSKQIYYKGINSTEEELNSQLINHLGMTGNVWLPSK